MQPSETLKESVFQSLPECPSRLRTPIAMLLTIALSLVANWVASENITGLTGEVACGHAAWLMVLVVWPPVRRR